MSTTDAPTIDRAEAARMLRAIRLAGPERDERVEWAACSMPDCRPAQRMMIQLHLERGEVDAALALIGRALRHRPTDPSLALLRARALLARGDIGRAEGPLRLALAGRPHHPATLELAGCVALRRGDPRRAAECFRLVDAARPSDRIKRRRVIALLEAGRPDLARAVLEGMEVQPATLAAQVLRVEGRLLEAIDLLAAARAACAGARRQRVTCMMIDLLEQADSQSRLRTVLMNLGPAETEARGRAGLAWLLLGEFTAAMRAVRPLQSRPGCRAIALTVILAAATMTGRRDLAERTLLRLRRLDEAVDRRTVADAWNRALQGRLMDAQRHPPVVTRGGVLAGLLDDAERILVQTLRVPEALVPGRAPHLARRLDACRTVRGGLARPPLAPADRRPAGRRRPGPIEMAAGSA